MESDSATVETTAATRRARAERGELLRGVAVRSRCGEDTNPTFVFERPRTRNALYGFPELRYFPRSIQLNSELKTQATRSKSPKPQEHHPSITKLLNTPNTRFASILLPLNLISGNGNLGKIR
ncbi:hypothetical protein Droror1_Dr00006312 [Drosera rotundifolia]